MGENTRARRGMARVALLLAAAMALGSLAAPAEEGRNSFTFDLTAAKADAASAFAPVTTDFAADAMIDFGEGAAPEAEPGDETLAEGEAEATAAPEAVDGGAVDLDTDALGDFGGPMPEEGAPADGGDDGLESVEEAAEPEPTATPKPKRKPVEITITAAGDTTLGGCSRNRTNVKFANVARKMGPNWFLGGVKKIFRNDDLTILNLEGPLTTARQKRKGQYYFFKGNPAYVKILTAGSVEICNVANNHALDYGAAGLKQTASVLKKAGIGVSGYDMIYTTTVKGVKVCSLGFTKWDHTAKDIKKAVKAARKKCDLLIVSVHWGWEKKFKPDSQQQAMGRAAVDAGADLVIGTHTHVYGGIERYKGKYIVYSLGNFCFGGNPNPTDKRCLIFQQTFRFDRDAGISDAGINIIPAKVSSSRKTNDYRPTLMGRAEGLKLLKAVAKVSRGFNLKNTLWTKSNYLVWAGIVSQKKLNALNARVKRSRTRRTKQKAKARYDAAALFAEETDADLVQDISADEAPAEDATDVAGAGDADAVGWGVFEDEFPSGADAADTASNAKTAGADAADDGLQDAAEGATTGT